MTAATKANPSTSGNRAACQGSTAEVPPTHTVSLHTALPACISAEWPESNQSWVEPILPIGLHSREEPPGSSEPMSNN